MSGGDFSEYEAGKFAADVYIKGGSANPFIFKGTVTTATSPTVFASTDLDGLGNDAFAGWYVFVFYDTAGTAVAPQGEIQPISDYVSATGTFTHTAFTADLVVGDEVFILHESLVVAIADSTNNFFMKDVVGNKTDTSAVPSNSTSVVAMVKKIYDEIVSISNAGELFSQSGPANVEIDDLANYYLELYDVGGDVPTTAEITPGNYQIDRIRNGTLFNIVASVAASEADGRIYCTETFDAASGWAIGDLVLVTFSGGSVTPAGGATTTLPNGYFYTRIVRGETIQTTVETILANQAGAETIASYDLPNDVAENILLTITNTKRLRLDAVWLDLVNLVQDVTIKVYHKIDGTTFRQYDVYSWGTAEEDGVLLSPVTINGDWKITVTSTVAQGAIKAIPYNVIKTTMEA